MGNSEVGHTNLGAGRVVYQDLTRIDKSIREGDFCDSGRRCSPPTTAARTARTRCTWSGCSRTAASTAISEHLHALIELAATRGVTRVFVHVLTDGRDTSPTGGAAYVAELEAELPRRASAPSRRSPAATTRWIATSGGSGPSSPTTRSCYGEGPTATAPAP